MSTCTCSAAAAWAGLRDERGVNSIGTVAAAVLALAVLDTPAPSHGRPRLSLDDVLRRGEQYVTDCEPRLSRVVAREEYVQRLSVEGQPGYQSRRVVSDFMFLRLPGIRRSWVGIREVLEVDGRLAGSARRLSEAAAASPDEIERLAEELAYANARYNLGMFVRNFNVPLFVLSWLHPDFRGHFAFRRAGFEDIDGTRAWRVEFDERERPTIIRTPDRKEVVSRGTIWLDPGTGRVLQTELRNKPATLDASIRVRFGFNEPLGIMVPIWMRERFSDRRGILDADATYSDFRRFEVLTRIK